MIKNKSANIVVRIPAVRGRVLGVNAYRGYAPLGVLSDISRADVYDQKVNPLGTQRDLSVSHARDAYEYVKNRDLGFWPEVFLCARNPRVITFSPISDDFPDLGILEIDLQAVRKSKDIAISRIDGNHRLHFADGKQKGYVRLEKAASFCLAFGLNRDAEIQLFKDINKNQKPMNTSHLDGIDVRLTPAEALKRGDPQLYIAKKLGSDNKSPFLNRIYDGGKKAGGVDIPLRSIKTGIEYMLSRSTQLSKLDDTDAKYKVIRNYFSAFKQWQPKSWTDSRSYITLRGAGLWAVCFIGAQVIDRVLLQDKFDTDSMLQILKSGPDWDWSKNGNFKGYSGRGGALEISKQVTNKLHDEKRMSTKDLFSKIMSAE